MEEAAWRADLPVPLLKPCDERHLRLAVVRVAGHDLVGEREAVGREDERDHDLQAVPAPVAAVAVTLEIAFERLRAVDLEVRAREIEEDDIAGRAEEPRPAVPEVMEEFVLERIPRQSLADGPRRPDGEDAEGDARRRIQIPCRRSARTPQGLGQENGRGRMAAGPGRHFSEGRLS